ncbi:hypothetical protein SAMN02745831_06060 [Streptomyces sp. PgraA7]|nr:hypothetical protein SAMN02745831_06060 [Streptomyces sp. PgraA7]
MLAPVGDGQPELFGAGPPLPPDLVEVGSTVGSHRHVRGPAAERAVNHLGKKYAPAGDPQEVTADQTAGCGTILSWRSGE